MKAVVDMVETTGLSPENALDPRMMALYRAATPESKLLAVARLNSVLLGLKEAQLATSHPEWTDGQRQGQLRRWWLGARD